MPVDVDVSSVSITANNGVTISSDSNTAIKAFYTVDNIAANAAARTLKYFDVLIRPTYNNNLMDDFSVRYKLAER